MEREGHFCVAALRVQEPWQRGHDVYGEYQTEAAQSLVPLKVFKEPEV